MARLTAGRRVTASCPKLSVESLATSTTVHHSQSIAYEGNRDFFSFRCEVPV